MRDFYIPSVKMTAVLSTQAHHGLASLSAPQVGLGLSFLVINQDLKDGQWDGYRTDSARYKAYINPTILGDAGEMTFEWEKCPSLSRVEARVERLKEVDVEYLAEDGEYVTDHLTEFQGRVFQHEVDHIWGFLISSFTVSEGNLRFNGPFMRAEGVAESYKQKAEEAKSRLEQRLLVDDKFKQEAEDTADTKGFIARRVLDEEFEGEFSVDLYEALLADIKSSRKTKDD
jgi:peptide deformylase